MPQSQAQKAASEPQDVIDEALVECYTNSSLVMQGQNDVE